jgi:hypothetical protein
MGTADFKAPCHFMRKVIGVFVITPVAGGKYWVNEHDVDGGLVGDRTDYFSSKVSHRLVRQFSCRPLTKNLNSNTR